jgi:hypothetical protein
LNVVSSKISGSGQNVTACRSSWRLALDQLGRRLARAYDWCQEPPSRADLEPLGEGVHDGTRRRADPPEIEYPPPPNFPPAFRVVRTTSTADGGPSPSGSA